MVEYSIEKNRIEISGEGDIVQGDKYRDIYLNYPDEKIDSINCWFCNSPLPEEKKDDEVVTCPICNSKNYRSLKLKSKFAKFKNLPEDKQIDYENKIFLISTLIDEGKYQTALNICEEAILLHSRTPDAWEYKALCYYFSIDRGKTIETSARSILTYLNAATLLRNDPSDMDNHTKISANISYRYYKTIIRRIESSLPNWLDGVKNGSLFKLVSELRTCYKIYKDVKYLKSLFSFLSGNNGLTWLFLEDQNESKLKCTSLRMDENDYILCDFSPINTTLLSYIEKLLNEIRNIDPKYSPPTYKFYSSKYNSILSEIEYLSCKNDRIANLYQDRAEFQNELYEENKNLNVLKDNKLEVEKWQFLRSTEEKNSQVYSIYNLITEKIQQIDSIKQRIAELDNQIMTYSK